MKSFLIVACLATLVILQANAGSGVRFELNEALFNDLRDKAAEAFLDPFFEILQQGDMQLPDMEHVHCPFTGEDMSITNIVLVSLNIDTQANGMTFDNDLMTVSLDLAGIDICADVTSESLGEIQGLCVVGSFHASVSVGGSVQGEPPIFQATFLPSFNLNLESNEGPESNIGQMFGQVMDMVNNQLAQKMMDKFARNNPGQHRDDWFIPAEALDLDIPAMIDLMITSFQASAGQLSVSDVLRFFMPEQPDQAGTYPRGALGGLNSFGEGQQVQFYLSDAVPNSLFFTAFMDGAMDHLPRVRPRDMENDMCRLRLNTDDDAWAFPGLATAHPGMNYYIQPSFTSFPEVIFMENGLMVFVPLTLDFHLRPTEDEQNQANNEGRRPEGEFVFSLNEMATLGAYAELMVDDEAGIATPAVSVTTATFEFTGGEGFADVEALTAQAQSEVDPMVEQVNMMLVDMCGQMQIPTRCDMGGIDGLYVGFGENNNPDDQGGFVSVRGTPILYVNPFMHMVKEARATLLDVKAFGTHYKLHQEKSFVNAFRKQTKRYILQALDQLAERIAA